jgi:N-acetylmuramoyl-L-alanine amidase
MPPWTCIFGHVLAASLLACAPGPAPDPAEAAPPATDEPDTPAPPLAVAALAAPAPTAPAPEPVPAASPPTLAIIDRPITYDEARRQKTITYRKRHQDPAADDITIDPRMIVLHFTGGGDLDATWRYFDRPTVERGRRIIARAGDLNVSAHFLVDRDGTIVRLVPETWMARHVVGLNHLAIGVENVGDGDRFPLTRAQQAANVALVRDLVARFPGITHLIGHHEYLAFEGHPYFREREADYRTRKGDPGKVFMAAVRAQLTDLGLAGPPARDRALPAARSP